MKMKPIQPVLNEDAFLGSEEDLLSLVATLAHKLAVELDFHYEEGAEHLQSEVEALEAATAALLMNEYLAPQAVHHAIEKFM